MRHFCSRRYDVKCDDRAEEDRSHDKADAGSNDRRSIAGEGR